MVVAEMLKAVGGVAVKILIEHTNSSIKESRILDDCLKSSLIRERVNINKMLFSSKTGRGTACTFFYAEAAPKNGIWKTRGNCTVTSVHRARKGF